MYDQKNLQEKEKYIFKECENLQLDDKEDDLLQGKTSVDWKDDAFARELPDPKLLISEAK